VGREAFLEYFDDDVVEPKTKFLVEDDEDFLAEVKSDSLGKRSDGNRDFFDIFCNLFLVF